MKKQLLLLCLAFLSVTAHAQSKASLKNILWNGVQSCYTNFEDIEGEDINITDDTKNGYLKISGSYPTCGCFCSATIGAYKNSKGDFTTLQTSSFTCNWSEQLTSNKKLEDILPVGFGIHEFMRDSLTTSFENPIFYAQVLVPRKGTDTRVKLAVVPFGLRPKGNGLLCYSYDETNVNQKPLYKLLGFAKNIQNEESLNQLLSGDYNAIPPMDKKQLDSYIAEDSFRSMDEIRNHLITLKKIYDVYLRIAHEEITLSWNRKAGRFDIKDKGTSPTTLTFQEFLIQQRYWMAMC